MPQGGPGIPRAAAQLCFGHPTSTQVFLKNSNLPRERIQRRTPPDSDPSDQLFTEGEDQRHGERDEDGELQKKAGDMEERDEGTHHQSGDSEKEEEKRPRNQELTRQKSQPQNNPRPPLHGPLPELWGDGTANEEHESSLLEPRSSVLVSAPMLTLIPEIVEQYAAHHTDVPAPLMDRLREETYASVEHPHMQTGRLEGTLLKLLVKISQARRVLEIGMFTGYSTLCMAEGLPEGGELITCEVNPTVEAVARRYFEQSPFGKRISIRMGPALETIATIKGPVDLVFIDADKGNYSHYYDAVFPLLPSGGLIVADNTLWRGRVLAPESSDDHALVAFNSKVASDQRVEKVLLTVRDGVLLARKK